MRGIPCVIPGTLEIEGRKKASELISEVTWDSRVGDGSMGIHGRCPSGSVSPCSGSWRLSCHLLPEALIVTGVSIQTI